MCEPVTDFSSFSVYL